MPTQTIAILVLVAFGLLCVLSGFFWYRSGRGARNAKRARKLGKQGERKAKKLLLAEGYRILDVQATKALTILVDGEKVTTNVRADFLLDRGGRRYVADAKAGPKAPSPKSATTRRQLLEYATAYDVDGVLLVDASEGKIHHVEFPALAERQRPTHQRAQAALALLLMSFAGLAGYLIAQ